MSQPKVTVVMSVYNDEPYLAEAVESILGQTFKNFEFLIVDDGSTDKSSAILKKYAAKDKRIRLLSQKNRGLVASLNRSIKEAGSEYIARQDADDKSAPNRLVKQIEFLKANPDVVIVGSSISVIDENGKSLHQHAVLLNDLELREELLVRSPFAHGSVVFKRQAAIDAGLYNKASWPAEDYDFWLRLSDYGQLANFDACLYTYREHDQSISQKNLVLQHKKVKAIRELAWKEHSRLMPKKKIDLNHYKNLDMGQQRIERIIDNNVLVSKIAWRHGQKSLAMKNMLLLAGESIAYRKTAGKIKRGIRS
jgi:glycosyltransferase involved in cell wall biosynthesis